MKDFFSLFLRSLPFVMGIILTLTAVSFLIEFASQASVSNLDEVEYWAFVIFAVIGIPLTLFGINRLSRNV